MRIAFLAAASAVALAALPITPVAAQATDRVAGVQKPQTVNIPAQIVARLNTVLTDPRRDADKARDQYRHPAETLALFQLEPGMTVVDYVPAGGWYTRIIAPYLGPSGRYIAMGPNVSGAADRQREYWGGQADKILAESASWNLGEAAALSGFNTDAVPEDLVGKVDRVVIFRELHNIVRGNWLHEDMLAIRKVLKPGGMVGVVQHRAEADAPYSMRDGNKGYLREKDVIALFDFYGFDLEARSEVNANPRDTKDWPDGV